MKTIKTHLQLSKSNGILAAIVDARRDGQYTRSKCWDGRGNRNDWKANRRTTKQQLRNYN